MDKFEKHVQSQKSKVRKARIKAQKRRVPGTTQRRKAAITRGVNRRIIRLENEIEGSISFNELITLAREFGPYGTVEFVQFVLKKHGQKVPTEEDLSA